MNILINMKKHITNKNYGSTFLNVFVLTVQVSSEAFTSKFPNPLN